MSLLHWWSCTAVTFLDCGFSVGFVLQVTTIPTFFSMQQYKRHAESNIMD